MKKYLLSLVVFVSGTTTMVLEIVGARILSPYLGTSLIVWSSLIGIILASLSLGYYFGGKLADRKAKLLAIFILLIASTVFILITAGFKDNLLSYLLDKSKNLELTSIVATLALFSFPNICLAAVLPISIKISIKNLKESGRRAGNLYAISTIGSVLGTFLAGFYLLPAFGSTKVLYFLAILLTIPAFAILVLEKTISRKLMLLFLIPAFVYLFLPFGKTDPNTVAEIDTAYSHITLKKFVETDTGRPTLNLYTHLHFRESAMFLDNDNDLVFRYQKFFRLAAVFTPNLNNSLAIGGAGYSFPKDFLKKNPAAKIDVVELDPGMTSVAKKYFNLPDNPHLSTYNEDARTFLNKYSKSKSYDAVYVDAFLSSLSVPVQLTTQKAVVKIYNILSPKGVVFLNLVSSLKGSGAKFFEAEFATYKSDFPQVYVFQVDKEAGPERPQNILIVALKSKDKPLFTSQNPEFADYLDSLWSGEISKLPVLTDDKAPVDSYMIYVHEKLL